MSTKASLFCDVCEKSIERATKRSIEIPCMQKPQPGFNPRFYRWYVVTKVITPILIADGAVDIDLCGVCFRRAMQLAERAV